MKPTRRVIIIRRLVLLLLAGAIVNVAVAWGIAALVARVEEDEQGRAREPIAFDADGRVTEWWWAERYYGIGTTVFGMRWYRLRVEANTLVGYPSPAQILPQWFIEDAPPPKFANGESRAGERLAILIGWPARSLACIARGNRENHVWHHGIVLDDPSWQTAMPHVLPLLPLWPGFAINTVFYAAILWLMFATPRALLRWRRMQRGLCPACAYPVGASEVCSECGAKLKASTSSPAGEGNMR